MKYLVYAAFLFASSWLLAQDPTPPTIQLVADPALSPDGSQLAFSWRGDIWTVDSRGGTARQVTRGPAIDREPSFSPQGDELAFVSDRDGSRQIWVMKATGGLATKATSHREGFSLTDWLPNGSGFLTVVRRDHFWRRAERIAIRPLDEKREEQIVFNGYASRPHLHPEGRDFLYTREGTRTWRKSYRGAQEAQVWLYDHDAKEHRLLHSKEGGSRYPLWVGNSRRYIYASAQSGTFNLVQRELGSDVQKTLTEFTDDGVHFPTISRDGNTVVFRHLFDLWRLDLESGTSTKLVIKAGGDDVEVASRRVNMERASDVSFSKDGREMAFCAGGDLWVMDTILREPVRVTRSAEEEHSPLFLDNETLLIVSDREGQSDIWRVDRTNDKEPFWRNQDFRLVQLTKNEDVESDLRAAPGHKGHFTFRSGRGDVGMMPAQGGERRSLIASWNDPDYALSPDGQWIAWAVDDNDFNRDVWLAPLDQSRAPFNLSCHPDNDRNPVWSPDGKLLAFTGRRFGTESDIVYLWLDRDEDETTSRERKLKKALEKMKERKKKTKKKADKKGKKETPTSKPTTVGSDDTKSPTAKTTKSTDKKKDKSAKDEVKVVIDFEGIRDRLRRVRINDSFERALRFVKKDELWFQGSIDGKSGVYKITFPEPKAPKLVSTSSLRSASVLPDAKCVAGLSGGVPATLSLKGKLEKFAFRARALVDLRARSGVLFDQAWRTMRDNFYDERMGNRDWDAVRAKYLPLAATCSDARSLNEVTNMMLGELNGSHLGFSAQRFQERMPSSDAWRESTGHFGLRFDTEDDGPGRLISGIVRKSPAAAKSTQLKIGERLMSIDGTDVRADRSLVPLMTAAPGHEFKLSVADADGEERIVPLRTTSYGAIRRLMYEEWILSNRQRVTTMSKGQLGYVHIAAMSGRNLLRFDAELYRVGHGKKGLIIDVRENGGGSITDHLLTCLCQPSHAITRPRGGGEGYPQDRRIYASWDKPILVLCNQNSFSNAEIFAHAIKTLGRGRVVGVRTAGGVISTGSASLMGLARLRMPFRGWHLLNGEDMELYGADPDVTIWPEPTEWPSGTDRQLQKGVAMLLEDVATWEKRPRAQLKKSSER